MRRIFEINFYSDFAKSSVAESSGGPELVRVVIDGCSKREDTVEVDFYPFRWANYQGIKEGPVKNPFKKRLF